MHVFAWEGVLLGGRVGFVGGCVGERGVGERWVVLGRAGLRGGWVLGGF